MTENAPSAGFHAQAGGARRGILVWLSTATHRALRIRVAQENTSIQRWVAALVELELGRLSQSGPLRGEEEES